MAKPYDYLLTIALIGDTKVGKTELRRRFYDGFVGDVGWYRTTMG